MGGEKILSTRAAFVAVALAVAVLSVTAMAEPVCSLTPRQKERFVEQFDRSGVNRPALDSPEFARGLKMVAIQNGMQDLVFRVCGLEAEAEAHRRLMFAIAENWNRIAACLEIDGDFLAAVRDGFDVGRRKMRRQILSCEPALREAAEAQMSQSLASTKAQLRQTEDLIRVLEINE